MDRGLQVWSAIFQAYFAAFGGNRADGTAGQPLVALVSGRGVSAQFGVIHLT